MEYYYEQKLMVELPTKGREYEPDRKPRPNVTRTQSQAATHETPGRLVRSRLDAGPAQILQTQYGYPRELVARALRLQFDEKNDDFQDFFQFYRACTEVASRFGIQPPSPGRKIIIPQRSQQILSQLKDDGTIIGEESYTVSYTEYSGQDPCGKASGKCQECRRGRAEYMVLPCSHSSLCETCAYRKVSFCPQCNGRVLATMKSFD